MGCGDLQSAALGNCMESYHIRDLGFRDSGFRSSDFRVYGPIP